MCISCLCSGNAHAQYISEEEKEFFEQRIKQTIELSQEYISNIANSSLRSEIRKENLNNFLSLFVANGGAYDYHDEVKGDTAHCPGTKIIVSGLKRSAKTYLLKNYLNKMCNSASPDSNISIEAADVIRIDSVTRIGSHYECTAYYTKQFVGFRDGRQTYKDSSIRKIKLFLDDTSNLQPKLGDIYVVLINKK